MKELRLCSHAAESSLSGLHRSESLPESVALDIYLGSEVTVSSCDRQTEPASFIGRSLNLVMIQSFYIG